MLQREANFKNENQLTKPNRAVELLKSQNGSFYSPVRNINLPCGNLDDTSIKHLPGLYKCFGFDVDQEGRH